MPSTNKTENIQLSQFTPTDKPSYLADYNQDNYKIDREFKLIKDKVEIIEGLDNVYLSQIAQLQTDLENAEYDIGINESNIDGIDIRTTQLESNLSNLETNFNGAVEGVSGALNVINGSIDSLDSRVEQLENTQLEIGTITSDGFQDGVYNLPLKNWARSSSDYTVTLPIGNYIMNIGNEFSGTDYTGLVTTRIMFSDISNGEDDFLKWNARFTTGVQQDLVTNGGRMFLFRNNVITPRTIRLECYSGVEGVSTQHARIQIIKISD